MAGMKSFFGVALLLLSGLTSGQTEVTPPDPSTGKLQVQGTHITTLSLRRIQDGHTETFKDPNGVLTLPEGTYSILQITLQDTFAYQPNGLPPLGDIVIARDRPCTLEIGGPLTPSLDITRQGRHLQLVYKLVGIGQETYTRMNGTPAKAPTFTVSQGEQILDTGTFEYG
jgi:hypothetical protein